MKKINSFNLFFLGIFSSSAFAVGLDPDNVKSKLSQFTDISKFIESKTEFSTPEGKNFERCYLKRDYDHGYPTKSTKVKEADYPLSPRVYEDYQSYQTFTVQFPMKSEVILVGICQKKQGKRKLEERQSSGDQAKKLRLN